MKLSRREEIAIAVLVVCAGAEPDLVRTEDVAAVAEATAVQTAQIVHALTRVGLIETTRGRKGGIRLKHDASRITLGHVLQAMGGRGRSETLPVRHNDPLAAIAAAASAQAREAFESFTIADLASGQVDDKLACFQCTIRLGAIRHVAGATRSLAAAMGRA